MIRIDEYGRGYTQLGSIAHQFKVRDTRDIYVMKISPAYKQKLLTEGLRVKLFTYDKNTSTYMLPPIAGELRTTDTKINFTLKSADLYDYQREILKNIRSNQNRSAFIVSGTATGKSYMLAGLIGTYKQRTIIVTPNIAIARGLLEKLSKYSNSVYLAQGVNILKATDDIVICHHTTFNTHFEAINGAYTTLIIDECFIANTKIDGRNIQDICVGDYVKSYNHNTQQIEYKKVLRTFKNPAKNLIKIGNLICTPEHPIWDGEKYSLVKDFKINRNMMFYIIPPKYEYMQSMLKRVGMVCNLAKKRFQKNLKNILFKRMFSKFQKEEIIGNDEINKSEILLGKNEDKQSNEKGNLKRENENYPETIVTQTNNTGWQLKAISDSPTTLGNYIMTIFRSCGKYWEKMRLISHMLQNRYSKQDIKNWNRSGLIEPLNNRETKTRQKETSLFGKSLMENPKVLEQTSDGTFGGMCPDGYVYNIEVEDNNNYFANGVLVHNCHHLPRTRIEQINNWKGGMVFGLTATPKRKEFGREGIEKLFGKIYDTGVEALPVKVRIHKFRYDYDEHELEEASNGLAPDSNEIFRRLIVNNNKRYTELITVLDTLKAEGYKKFIVFSDRVKHMENLIDILKEHSYNPIGYYGASNKSDSETKIKESDDYVIVGHPTSCGEGFDVPDIEVSILFVSTGREPVIQQIAGRARRYNETKVSGILVDFVDELSIMGGKIKRLSFSNRMKVYKQLDWETTAL